MASEKEKNKKPYSEQCFIKDFIDFFSSIHGPESQETPSGFGQSYLEAKHNGIINEPLNLMKVDRRHLHQNTTTQSESANEGSVAFMTELASNKAQTLLESVPKELLSNLQPKIELFKVFYEAEEDRDGIAVPLPLNNFAAPSETTDTYEGTKYTGKNDALPGHLAVGLKDLSFDYLGTNPAEVDYFINVNLRLWFSTADAMFHQYPVPERLKGKLGRKHLSFSDLIMRPQKYTDAEQTQPSAAHNIIYGATNHMAWDPKYFRIRIDISYADAVSDEWLQEAVREIYGLKKTQHGAPDLEGLKKKKEDLHNALSTIKSSFFLNLLRHTFNFRGDLPSSPFEVNLTYNGAVETALYSPDADLLRSISADEEKIARAKNEGNSWYQWMTYHAEQIRTNYGFDPRGYRSGEFFQFKDSSGFHWNIFDRDNLRKNHYIMRTDEGQYPGTLPDTTVIPKVPLKITSHAPARKKAGWPTDTKIPYADAGTNTQNKFANELLQYYIARKEWHLKLKEIGQSDDQIKTANYTRLLDELTKNGRQSREASLQRNRFYQLTLQGKEVQAYLRLSRGKGLKENEQNDIKKIQSGNLRPEEQRKEIEKIRANRRERVAGVLEQRRAIYKKLYKELAKPGVKWEENSKRFGAVDVPKLPTGDPSPNHLFDWKKKIGAWVEQQEEYSGTNEMEESDLNPDTVAPKNTEEGFKISWIYFGDLIDAALEIIRDSGVGNKQLRLDIWDQEKGGSLKVILGDVTYFDQIEGKKKTISLVDLPISFELFREFWTAKVVKPMRERYSFLAFLKDAMTELVQAALTNKCAERGEPIVGIRPHIFQQTVPKDAARKIFSVPPKGEIAWLYSRSGGENIHPKYSKALDRTWRAKIHGRDASDPNTLPDIPSTVPIDPTKGAPADLIAETVNLHKKTLEEQQEIIYVCATTDKPTSFMVADKKKDLENGIYYLEVGTDGTPVQSISFTKMDQPGYLESKGETSGFKGEPLMLSEPYNCTFSLFGNNFLKPGVFVYIRLPHFGLPKNKFSPAQRLGLGGYFMITKTSNSLVLVGNKIDWTTDVTSVWNSFGDKNALANRNRAHY